MQSDELVHHGAPCLRRLSEQSIQRRVSRHVEDLAGYARDEAAVGRCPERDAQAEGPVTTCSAGPEPLPATPTSTLSSFHEYAYDGLSTACHAGVRFSGRNVSHITASSLVDLAPSAFSTAPGWGPCGSPLGCSVIIPMSTPFRAA